MSWSRICNWFYFFLQSWGQKSRKTSLDIFIIPINSFSSSINNKFLIDSYFIVFCSRIAQSGANWLRLVLKNKLTSFWRAALGAKHPVANQSNSQPRSSLILFLLSVNCFIIWQYISSFKISLKHHMIILVIVE